MLIYIFVDNYPNPYKPYYDTQFCNFIEHGHDIKIFANQKYLKPQNPEVKRCGLYQRTKYYPTTIKLLFRHILDYAKKLLKNPYYFVECFQAIHIEKMSSKAKMMHFSRLLLLPDMIPDICLIHNLSVFEKFQYINKIYPSAKIIMYFHGGEVARTPTVQTSNKLFENIDEAFTNTKFSKRQLIKRGCPEKKIKILPVGFNIDDYSYPYERKYKINNKLNIISAGRLAEGKGYDIAINAIKLLIDNGFTNLHYTIVGDGYMLSELRTLVVNAGLQKWVEFRGGKTKLELNELYRQADILLLPSVTTNTWAETQACVVQEAMLLGVIVVASRTGGVPESMPNIMQQFLVDEGDSSGIAEKVKQIQKLSNREISEIAKQGRKFVVKNYDITNLTLKLLDS